MADVLNLIADVINTNTDKIKPYRDYYNVCLQDTKNNVDNLKWLEKEALKIQNHAFVKFCRWIPAEASAVGRSAEPARSRSPADAADAWRHVRSGNRRAERPPPV